MGRSCAQVQAFEEQQKYKEGKFILEKAMIHKVRARPRRCPAPAAAPCRSVR